MFGIESYKNINNQSNLEEEEEYRQKYLKYKQKYLELKQSGGGLNGEYIYLTTEEKAKELVALFTKCGNPTEDNLNAVFNQEGLMVSAENKKSELKTTLQNFYTQCNSSTELEINTLLHDDAYRIKKNSKVIELVLNVSTIAKVGKSITGLFKGKKAPDAESSKKNSAKMQFNTTVLSVESDDQFNKILSSIKVANQERHSNATKLTHYVSINHKSELNKDSSTLVNKENPVKPLPSQ